MECLWPFLLMSNRKFLCKRSTSEVGVNTEAATPRRWSQNGPLCGKVLFLDKVFEGPLLEQHRRKELWATWGQTNPPQTSLWLMDVADMSPHFFCGVCVNALCNRVQGFKLLDRPICEARFLSLNAPDIHKHGHTMSFSHFWECGWNILNIKIFYQVLISLLKI